MHIDSQCYVQEAPRLQTDSAHAAAVVSAGTRPDDGEIKWVDILTT